MAWRSGPKSATPGVIPPVKAVTATESVAASAQGPATASSKTPDPAPAAALAPAPAAATGDPQAGTSGSGDLPSPTLHVTLACQDIAKDPEGEILVVGRYADTPLTGAVGAIDRALGGMLRNAIEMGMFNSELGELFYIPMPTTNPKVKAKAVIVAGMGKRADSAATTCLT